MYTQITAIILMPTFPGWLAPMHFNPTRFEEFLSFAITVCGTWVGASWLVGGYKANATSGDLTFLADPPLCYLHPAQQFQFAVHTVCRFTSAGQHALVSYGSM